MVHTHACKLTPKSVRSVLALCSFAAMLGGCGGGGTGPALTKPPTPTPTPTQTPAGLPQHVIIVVQENRSVDNLFAGFAGADTQAYGYDSKGQRIPLKQVALGAPYDPKHSHESFVTEFNNGAMNGFDANGCEGKPCPSDAAYEYVDPADIAPYRLLAAQNALADHVLQANEGPSFAAHIYLIAGQSGSPGSRWYIAENVAGHQFDNCLAPPSHTVQQIDMTTPYPGVEGNPIFPCIDPPTVLDELDKAGIGWRYYTPALGWIWTSPLAIRHLYDSPSDRARVVTPETSIFNDIRERKLQPVSYVIPRIRNSDHGGPDRGTGGPAWVASIVNAIGGSPYWANTAIVVTWDDWGGWFDHYVPTHPTNPLGGTPDPYEYGFRVPVIAAGSMAKTGYIDHTPRSSAAIVHFIEDVYGLPSLGELDAQTDDLFSMFAFGSPRKAFEKIPTGAVTIESLRNLPPDSTPIDAE
jgi:phospholipase C